MAEKLKISSFKASDGWLAKFRNRYQIRCSSLHGESGSVDLQIVDKWKDEHTAVLQAYNLKDIFNVDETGLFWKCTPRRSLVLKNEVAKGTKFPKERLTLLLCCSALGEKLKPVVVGKSKNPRAFKKRHLPITYESNSSAWMTMPLFSDWLKNLNETMKSQKRNILLLLDNAPVHPIDLNLSNICLLFFPKNSTSIIQPLDQGIIRSFKCHYRFKLMSHLLSFKELDELEDSIKNFNLNDAMHWISQSWDNVSTSTIINCFNHAELFRPLSNDIDAEMSLNDGFLEKVSNECNTTIDEFVNFDNDNQVFEEVNSDVNEEELLMLATEENVENNDSEDENDMEVLLPSLRIKSINEAISNLNDIILYLEKYELSDETNSSLMKLRSDLNSLRANSATKQTSIDNFFQY